MDSDTVMCQKVVGRVQRGLSRDIGVIVARQTAEVMGSDTVMCQKVVGRVQRDMMVMVPEDGSSKRDSGCHTDVIRGGEEVFSIFLAVFSLNNGTSFNDLCEVIRSKFPRISTTDFTVKYVLPGSEPCVLLCDDDMRFMFAFILIVMVEHVELILQLIKGPSDLRTDVIPSVNPKFSLDIDVDKREQSGGRVFLCEAWKGCITHVQQRFPRGVKDFWMELGKYCIACGFEVDFKKNDHSRVIAVCSKSETERCEWFIHAVLRRSYGSFIIKKLINKHTCSGRMMGKKSKMVRSKVITSVLSDKVHFDHLLTAKKVVKNLKREYGITVPY
ncbi:hypothetical protein LguiB_009204 [Lonicera macranthoides]